MVDDTSDVRKTFNDYLEESAITLMRMAIPEGHKWCNHCLAELKLPANKLIAMIKRGDENIIPDGNTKILLNDVLVIYYEESV